MFLHDKERLSKKDRKRWHCDKILIQLKELKPCWIKFKMNLSVVKLLTQHFKKLVWFCFKGNFYVDHQIASKTFLTTVTCTFQKSSKVMLHLLSVTIASLLFVVATSITLFASPNSSIFICNKSSQLRISSTCQLLRPDPSLDNLFFVSNSHTN